MDHTTYHSWEKLAGHEIPSSVNSSSLLRDKLNFDDYILDIGCGQGKTCLELLDKGYQHVTGVDINRSAVDLARNRASKIELSRDCSFLLKNIMESGLPDDFFDVAIMQAFLTTLTRPEDRRRALSEAKRLLRSGGGLYLGVFMQTWYHPKMRSRYQIGEKITGDKGTFPVYAENSNAIKYHVHHYSEEELVKLLLDAGFQIETFQYQIFRTQTGNQVNGAVVWAVA